MDEVGRSVAEYDFGAEAVARSPLGVEDLDLLKQTVLFTEEDDAPPPVSLPLTCPSQATAHA